MFSLIFAAASLNQFYADHDLKGALDAYRACVREKASTFEKAGEAVDATANAAFLACGDEEATIKLIVDDLADQQGLSFERKKIREDGVIKAVEEPLRAEVVEDLMMRRVQEKNARH